MKKFKKYLFGLACVCLMTLALYGKVEAGTKASGTYGENVTWSLSDDGVLTISGTGSVASHTQVIQYPWNDYGEDIKRVIIGKDIAYVDNSAFSECSKLDEITFENGNSDYFTDEGVLFWDWGESYIGLECCPQGRTGSYTVPNYVKFISVDAFLRCNGLTSINIPAGVEDISGGFRECNGLQSITVAGNNPYFSEKEGVVFNKNNTKIVCFPAGRTSYTIPNGVTTIGSYAFSGCSKMTSVSIPSSVTTIEGNAFSWSGLTSISIPTSVTAIGECAFANTDDHNLDIYYEGTEDQWKKIQLHEEALENVDPKRIHYLVPVTGISLSPATEALFIGQTAALTATVTPENATNKEVTWSSSNPAVATVDTNGVVTGVSAGQATITATTTDGGKTATATITVKRNEPERTNVEAKTIKFKKTSLKKNYNDAPFQLEIKTLKPDNADVFWKSDKEDVATVDAFGVVTPHAEGKAKITAYGKNDKVKATCTITVNGPQKPKSVKIDKVKDPIKKDQTIRLTAQIKPETGIPEEYRVLKWSLAKGNKGHATINENTGELTCTGGGDIKVQVETVNGKKGNLVVKGPKALKGIKISKTSLKIDQDKEKTLTISPNPKEAELEGEVTWISDNPEIAKVVGTGNTATVYGVKGGTAKVTASVGGKSKTCKITVKGPIYVEGVSLNKTEVTLKQGKNVTLKPKFKPTKPTNKNVTWTSSDTNVATVSANGKVVAVNPGKATITVKTADGGFTATSTITVVENAKKK